MSDPAVAAGPSRPRRWIPLVAGGAAFLLVLLTGGLLGADWAVRTAETRSLLTAIEASEASMIVVQDDVAAAFDAFDAAGQSAEARADLDASLREIAAEGAVAIETAGLAVTAVEILPWHGALERARDAYVLHNVAWVDYLNRAKDDPEEFVIDQDEVNRTFMEAEPMLRRALPWPVLPSLVDRVDIIFAEPEPEPGSVESTATRA